MKKRAKTITVHALAVVQRGMNKWMHVREGDGFTEDAELVTCPMCADYLAREETA